jgi:hypothetical protein
MPTPDLIKAMREEAEAELARVEKVLAVLDQQFPRPGRRRKRRVARPRTKATS